MTINLNNYIFARNTITYIFYLNIIDWTNVESLSVSLIESSESALYFK